MRKKAVKTEDVTKCGACAAYDADVKETYGFCRKNPPVWIPADEDSAGGWSFPTVSDTEFCLQFTRKLQS